MTHRNQHRAAVVALASATILAACASDNNPTTAESPTATSTATAGTSTAATPAATDPSTSAPAGSPSGTAGAGAARKTVSSDGFPSSGQNNEGLVPAGAEITSDGGDRVTFTFSGTGTPGYKVHYVDAPQPATNGKAPQVKGTAFLQVMFSGLSIPQDVTNLPQTSYLGSGAIAEVNLGLPFEGMATSYIGLDSERAFDVALTRSNPPQLVIDFTATNPAS